MKKQLHIAGVTQFNEFLSVYAREAQTQKINENYYHHDVVLDAYCKGLEKGQEKRKEEVEKIIIDKYLDRFKDRANQVYQSAKAFVDLVSKNRFSVKKFYINVFHRNPKVIVVVDEKHLLDDDFVYFVYPKLNEMKDSFFTLFGNTLDISLVGDKDLSEDLLKSDGFGYSEDVK